MSEQKVGIVADCICDLPKNYLSEHGIGIVCFLIETDNGVFTDTEEITADNILGYMEEGGKKSLSYPPPKEDYINAFESGLSKYERIIHISISSHMSDSFNCAEKAISEMGEKGSRIINFDSENLSTGAGHIVCRAAEMAETGASAEEIISELEELRKRVSTTFLTLNADYMSRSGRVSESLRKLCDLFRVHPVLMMKNGEIMLKSVLFGNYEKASMRYVCRELKKNADIDKNRVFIVHAGCSMKKIEQIKNEVNLRCPFEQLVVTRASATVSSSCGPDTFGVMFVRKS